MNWLSNLINSLFQKPDISTIQPTSSKKVSGDYIFNILNSKFPSSAHIYLSDIDYYLCSKKDIETFLSIDATNKIGYIPEKMDCDDFSYRLMGQLSIPNWSAIAFGILWTNVHALNCFIDETGTFYYIEPQSDNVQRELATWQGNEVLLIVM